MTVTPYQIAVPLLALVAIGYAWSLVSREKKTVWEAMLWTLFWGAIAAIAMFPHLLGYVTAATGIKSQANAVLITCIGILFFALFYVILRVEELEQRQTRMIRTMALREAELTKEKAHTTGG